MIILLNNMMSFAMPVSDKKTQEDAILYEYTDGNTEPVVFTMDLFNETFTREDVKNILYVTLVVEKRTYIRLMENLSFTTT